MRWKPNLNRKRKPMWKTYSFRCTRIDGKIRRRRQRWRRRCQRRNEIENGIENKRIYQEPECRDDDSDADDSEEVHILVFRKEKTLCKRKMHSHANEETKTESKTNKCTDYISHNHLIHIFEMFWLWIVFYFFPFRF